MDKSCLSHALIAMGQVLELDAGESKPKVTVPVIQKLLPTRAGPLKREC